MCKLPNWLAEINHRVVYNSESEETFIYIGISEYLEPRASRDYAYLFGDLNQIVRNQGVNVVLSDVSGIPMLYGSQNHDFSLRFTRVGDERVYEDAEACLSEGVSWCL